jgi:hypothetical protein
VGSGVGRAKGGVVLYCFILADQEGSPREGHIEQRPEGMWIPWRTFQLEGTANAKDIR